MFEKGKLLNREELALILEGMRAEAWAKGVTGVDWGSSLVGYEFKEGNSPYFNRGQRLGFGCPGCTD
jgi:hypothetical protein